MRSADSDVISGVLVVDDQEATRDVYSRACRLRGHHVQVAEDGSAALAILERESTRMWVVVLDWRMPVMGGAAFLRRLEHLPIRPRTIVISGDPAAEDESRALGVDAFLLKPVPVLTVLDTLQELTDPSLT